MEREYPWKCRKCRRTAVSPVTVDYTADMEHDGRKYTVTVPQLRVLECAECHARLLPDESYLKLDEELRKQAGLLLPAQIRSNRERHNLTQKQLAALVGIAEATLSRWETGGQIQQRSLDR